MTLVVAALVGIVPNLAGAATTSSAPYRHSTVVWASYAASVACARAWISAPPRWLPASGVGVAGGSAQARSCPSNAPGGPIDSVAVWGASWYVTVPLRMPVNASTAWVNASWGLRWTETNSLLLVHLCGGRLVAGSSFGFLDCHLSASVSMELLSAVVDVTANRAYGSSSVLYPSLYNYSSESKLVSCTPACTHTITSAGTSGTRNGSSNFTYRFAVATPNATHAWELVTYFLTDGFAQVETSSLNFTRVALASGSADASINFGTGSNGVDLTRVVVA